MAWLWLVVAGALEIVWALSMKLSNGFTRGLPAAITLAAMVTSFGFLSLAMKTLPLGTAYSVWTAIGAVGAFVSGAIVLDEPLSIARVVAVTLITCGVIVLKLTS